MAAEDKNIKTYKTYSIILGMRYDAEKSIGKVQK